MAPVGCYESLHAAINAGANSVYFGIGRLNMRSASAANFSEADMEQIVEIAHKAGVKTYLTVNTIIYDDELAVMHDVINKAKELLTQSGLSVQEVAERLNFVSQSFFGKYFKQRTGVSPSRYKVQS